MKIEGDFHEQGYAHLKGFISEEMARALLRELWKRLGDGSVPLRSPDKTLINKHAVEIHGRDYLPMAHFHWGITPMIASLAGADLLPSFSWFRMYVGGDVCRVHSDRPACEYSLSLTLAYSDDEPWALSLGTRSIDDPFSRDDDFGDEPFVSIDTVPGGAVLYRGSSRRHGRVTPNTNRWSAHLFLQWVEREGAHRDVAFEGIMPPETLSAA